MQVLEVGQSVFLLRFLPDGRRLVMATMDPDRKVTFEVLSLPGGERVQLHVPGADIDSWWYSAWYSNPIAIDPSGQTCYLAWADRLYHFRTSDGKAMPVRDVEANQLVLSPDGSLLLAARRTRSVCPLTTLRTGAKGGKEIWTKEMRTEFNQVAGFLPDGARFVTIESVVRIRSSATGDELAAGRHKPVGSQQPQVSTDGRYLGSIGYGSMYFWDLATLDKPRQIKGSGNFGDFRSFAFHPDGKTVAVIHGGPTLVKVYDVETLKLVHKWNWKLGPLRSVAYSPDGTLGAAGSEDGRIVVWDVDE
jgi:WD40 repeat protein